MEQARCVDVAINVYGKPWQTAAALLSLWEWSGGWIDRIWLVTERRQPRPLDLSPLVRHFDGRITTYTPRLWLWTHALEPRLLYRWKPLRWSVRYQYAWEHSRNRYLFTLHNDMLFHGDLLGAMLERMGDRVAVGPVGQCWNCPAQAAGRCGPERYEQFRPTFAELEALNAAHPAPRATAHRRLLDPQRPWPLPECRLNEWAALIDLDRARPLTIPHGKAVPFGALHGLDIGTQWFREVLWQGARIGHFDIAPYATHAWTTTSGNGHADLFDAALYDRHEAVARDHVRHHYAVDLEGLGGPRPPR